MEFRLNKNVVNVIEKTLNSLKIRYHKGKTWTTDAIYRETQKKLETRKIPDDIDYDAVPSLRIEAVQKLKQYKPVSIGQASRISGVSPADISVLLVYLGH